MYMNSKNVRSKRYRRKEVSCKRKKCKRTRRAQTRRKIRRSQRGFRKPPGSTYKRKIQTAGALVAANNQRKDLINALNEGNTEKLIKNTDHTRFLTIYSNRDPRDPESIEEIEEERVFFAGLINKDILDRNYSSAENITDHFIQSTSSGDASGEQSSIYYVFGNEPRVMVNEPPVMVKGDDFLYFPLRFFIFKKFRVGVAKQVKKNLTR